MGNTNDTPSSKSRELEFEKFKYKVELFKWLIGSVALVLVTTIIDWGFKDRAAGLNEIKEYDKYATELIVLNNDPVKKRMLAQYFAHVTPSEKLQKGWEAYFKEVDKEYIAFLEADSMAKVRLAELSADSVKLDSAKLMEISLLGNQIMESQRIINQPLIIPTASTIVPVVFIQIGEEANRNLANEIRPKLIALGFKAPGVELVESASKLNGHEIRYFRDSDLNYANQVHAVLEQEGISSILKIIPSLGNRTKEGTIEIWLRKIE